MSSHQIISFLSLSTDPVMLEIHRFAAFLTEKGVRSKDIIAVFTTNSPEMIVTVLALSKLGAVAGLINTNLRGNF